MAKTKHPSKKQEQIDWQAKANEYLLGWQRTQADFENYRRRTEEQRSELTKLAAAESLLHIAPILDDFRRAFQHVPPDQLDSAWVTGMQQVEKHLRSILESAGLVTIENGGPFNPVLHDAIVYEQHPELPDGTIIDIIELGWKLGDRVIKPARVRVSRGKS